MRSSVVVPIIFAALGAIVLSLSTNPRHGYREKILRSRDRLSVQRRLDELGESGSTSFETFRSKQISKTLYVAATTFLALIIFRKPLFLTLHISIFAAFITYMCVDRQLSMRIRDHRLRVDSEFPAIIEMYSLAMSAGETPLAAMDRIGLSANGAMAIEFNKVVALVKSGTPFHLALDEMGRQLDSLVIRRFIDSLIIATLRGAPLIDVLQRHALEAREAQRNRVLGAAAKAEISMMIPIVFLILPISILFALWPSLTNLNLFSSA